MQLVTVSIKKEIGQTCIKCCQGKFVLRYSKFGFFLGCSRYPVCKFTITENMIEEDKRYFREKKKINKYLKLAKKNKGRSVK